MKPGSLVVRNVWVDGRMVGVRVDHASSIVLVHTDLIAAGHEPGATLDGDVLTINALNGTWRYSLREGGERPHNMHLADLIEAPD